MATDNTSYQELQETAQKILGQVILKKGEKIGKIVSTVIEQSILYAVVSLNEGLSKDEFSEAVLKKI